MEEKGGLEEVLWRTKLASHCLGSNPSDVENEAVIEAQKKNTIEINRTTMKLFSVSRFF